MGCFQSKKDSGDIHPNVFRVVNIDEGGAELWSGQLEITETDLILYREGRDATIWPLASLRRYGFEGEIFSFESGRRCATGEGIYAFRCRRAGMLFRTLQQNIQMRNVIQESLPFQLPSSLAAGSPSSVPRQTLQASVVHRSSIDSGQPVRNILPASNHNLSNHMQMHTGPVLSGPRSPSSADILEVMPLYPRPQNNSNQVTNVYQVKDFKSKEHNNNQGEPSTDLRHLYSNDFNRDLAALRNTLKKEAAINCMRDNEEDSRFIRSRYMNESLPLNKENAPLSPTLSNTSEHYAQLNEEKQQEAAPLYVNIAHTEESDFIKSDPVPTTPITPKQMDYYNFGIQAKFEMNSYANLSLGDMSDNVANAKAMHFNSSHLDHGQKFSESDTTSMSPIEDLQYALLDMDKKRKSINTLAKDMTSPKSLKSNNSQNLNQTRGQHISQNSLEKASTTNQVPPGVGYTTIDFDKTVALTSVATGTDIDADGVRTTRHNITNTTCGSPTTDRHRI